MKKVISIEGKIYIISLSDFKKIIRVSNNKLNKLNPDISDLDGYSDVLGEIEEKYQPETVLDGVYNY